MLYPLLLVSSLLASPVDILARIDARKGHAFVSQTNRPWTLVYNARKGDEVVLSNIARRWNLAYRPTAATVTPVALPLNELFPLNSQRTDWYQTFPPKEFRAKITKPGGMALRVRELLTGGGLDFHRCHWYYWDRLVLARVRPEAIEAALPDLAISIGALYDPKTRRIESTREASVRCSRKALRSGRDRRTSWTCGPSLSSRWMG